MSVKIPKFFPFISFNDEDGDNGGGQGDPQEVEGVQPEQQEDTSSNPAWNDILNPVPEEFHPHLKEHLSKTDKYTQEVQQRFAPFKGFAENGVKPEDIQEALQFAHFLNTNPRGVYDFLNTQYNYSQVTAEPSQGSPAKENEVDVDDPFANVDISKNPQFMEVANQAKSLQAAYEADRQQKLNDAADKQVAEELKFIETNYPKLDPREVITRAMGKQSAGFTKDIDIKASAKELDEMFNKVAPANPGGSSAPPVLGRTSLPSSQVTPGSMTREQRSQLVADMLRAANGDEQ